MISSSLHYAYLLPPFVLLIRPLFTQLLTNTEAHHTGTEARNGQRLILSITVLSLVPMPFNPNIHFACPCRSLGVPHGASQITIATGISTHAI